VVEIVGAIGLKDRQVAFEPGSSRIRQIIGDYVNAGRLCLDPLRGLIKPVEHPRSSAEDAPHQMGSSIE
jgi:hypothetical protein